MEIDPAPKNNLYFLCTQRRRSHLTLFCKKKKNSLWRQVTSPPPFILTFQSLAVTLGTARFTIKKILHTGRVSFMGCVQI